MFILSNDKKYEHYLEKCIHTYGESNFTEYLNAALKCFKFSRKSSDNLKKFVAVRLIKHSAEKMMVEFQPEVIHDELKIKNELKGNKNTCSFCNESGERMRFVCGAGVRICHKCIDSAYDVIHSG